MKYKVGDKVRIRSKEWYDKHKDANGEIRGAFFDKDRAKLFMLFPLWYCFLLPYGTKVINIWGEETIYNEKTDLDVRFGCVAFGINIEK